MSMSIAEARGQLALACPAGGCAVLARIHLTGPSGPISGAAPREGAVEVLFDEANGLSVQARFRDVRRHQAVQTPADVAGWVDAVLAEIAIRHPDARVDAGSPADFAAFSETALLERIGQIVAAREIADTATRVRQQAVRRTRGDQLLADIL